MPYEFTIDRMVDFADTDAGGIAHFSSIFRFMEAAEHAFIRSTGISIKLDLGDGSFISFPRVHVEADFHSPLRFEDTARTHVMVREVRSRSIIFDFMIHGVCNGETRFVARGSMTVACVKIGNGSFQSVEIPPSVLEKIEPAPPQALEQFQNPNS